MFSSIFGSSEAKLGADFDRTLIAPSWKAGNKVSPDGVFAKMLNSQLPIALVLTGFVLPPLSSGSQPSLYSDLEAYKVYEAILPENRAYTNAISVLIREKTIFYDAECLKSQSLPLSFREALADYRRKNQTALKLGRLFRFDKMYELLPESEFRGGPPASPLQLRNSSRWRQYLLTQPNFRGFVELSGVGFSRDRTVALVYVVRNCGILCSSSQLTFLKKHEGRWMPTVNGLGCFWNS